MGERENDKKRERELLCPFYFSNSHYSLGWDKLSPGARHKGPGDASLCHWGIGNQGHEPSSAQSGS